ncbi:MAG: HYR domain-containing protein, partial [Saprospiraceae bacterium]
MKKGLLLAWAFCASCAAFAQAPQTLPFSQNWSNAGLIAVDDNWGGVPGIQGRRGDGITGGTGVDPQTLLAADDPGVVDVNANRADPNTFATGGTTEFDGIGNPVVALSGSATADAPYLLIAINTSGKNNISVTYNVRDIDGSVDNAIQQLALQYRIGNAGAFTNIPAGYVADATTGPNLAILVTAVNVILPAACDNKAEVQLRIMTTNAVGNDEWIGIDDISITAPCDITSVAFANVGACNGNGTGDPTDDFFTADVVVDFINPPATGNLQIEPGGDAIGTYSIPVANLVGNSHTFVGVQFKADGTPTVIEVEFTIPANQCVQTQTGPTVQSCSPVCDITSVAFANVGACNDNISSDPTDDFFTADVVVDFVNPPATGNLQIEPGGDAIGIYSIPVANLMGNSHTFVGVQFKADGTPTVAEVEFTIPANQCVQTQTGPTVQPCSAACNVSASIAATNQFCVFPGEVQATGTGGILPYTYQLTGPGGYDQTNTTGLFTGLAAGLYTLTVSDSHVPPCTFTTTVNILFIPDTQAPTFNQNPLPANLLLSCSDPIPAAATLTATDDCDGPVPVSFNQNTTPGTCPQKSVITRTWSATDAAGNNRQHTQTITVEDNTPPTLNGLPAASISVECDAPLPSAPTVTATDLCDPSVSVTFSSNTTPGTCPQEYTLARTWSATDDCGNAAIFTQTITVTDNTPPTFNQSPLPQDITVSCSDISMPEVLDGTDNCDPGVAPPVVFINEIHYDNAGTDAGEFIEIAGTAGVDLSQYQIVLYNGTGGAVYNAMPLSGLIDNEAGGFGAVSFAYPVNGIQNGAPDGIVLATTSGIVLQFLSYEGAFTAVGGVANGILSTDIGVLEDGTNAVGTSLQLTGAGQQYGDFSWVGPLAASAGSLNAGQALNPLPGVIAAMFSQMIEAGDCNGESTITRMWELSDACGNAIMHTQIITVTDTDGPAFSPPPLPMDMNLSCEQPVPPAPTLTAADLCDVPGMLTERVWINEIHYDNAGVDVGEFIEIAGTAGIDLANYTLVLYNGNGGASYNTLVLSGIVPNQANGFGALCFNYGSNIIQNGSPDGVALVHNVMGGMVVQFLSYEGVFAAVGGPANGMNSTDIGVLENGTNAVGTSLYLTGNGDEYADFTWTGPLPASNCGVNAAQTFIPMSMGPVVTFSESQAPGTCPQERSILRTWTATDNCGNETVLNQIISIVDDTPPTVTCPGSITLNLDAFGNASLSLSNITFSYSDNCAPTASLVVLPFPTQFFDCDDEGLTRKVTVRVQDPCGNVGSCTIDVVVAPYSRCTPVILITDPCVCKNNATTLTNGQFGETIKIESLAGKTWTIIANTGLFSSASPIPPSSPILLPIGTAFVENPVGSGDYFLSGIHVDAQGYSITVRSETGQILSIGNSCQYPNPTITADLSGPFCLFSDPVTLTGTPGDANIVSQGFTVNGIPATVFDPSQGLGQYEIVYTVNGGVPKAFGPNDPGCIQSVTLFVNVLATPANIACNDLVYISLDDETCAMELTPDMILEGSYVCFDDYIVEIDQTLPFGNGPWLPAFVDMDDIGKTYQVRVTHLVSDNKCWGNIKIEDKLAPVLLCQNFSVHCNTPDLSANYLFDVLDILAALPTVTDCQTFNLTYTDTETERDCASGLTKVIARKWAAVDASGNSATCNQTIGLIRPTLADVVCPPDYDGLDKPAFQCTNNTYPTPDWIEGQGLQGYPWVFGRPSGCSINWVYTDLPIPVCDGTYKIVRTWRIVDWCVGELIYCNQLIKIVDEQGPAMVCPPNTTVSVEPFQCCAIANLPDVVIRDNCSRINNIGGMVQTFDPFTNQLTGMFPIGGSLEDFPDNNWWDRDTLAAFGSTPCLPIGTQRVTYIAEDNCGNTRSCTFSLKVEDLVPPVVACDELTKVALSADGMAFVDASTFDNGSYDVCSPVFFKARRMNSNSCQSNGQFQDQVKFCCGDIGKVVTIVLRVYDVSVPAGAVSTTLQENHANDCMVDVLVEEKIKPSCLAPAHVTVNCENFDPTLWVYGTAESEDNCCVDSIARTVNYAQFDTVCSKGTITRTFRAVDCAGNFSQCTQRIVVTYDQDYFVRFPNDVIVTVCDGTGVYGEPTFFGEDCELLGVSYEDEVFTVVPDACLKIERTWTVINWCTYDPNDGCINVPNPTPNTTVNHPTNLPGVVVSRCGIQAPSPWKSTIVKIYPSDPAPGTDYCTFWDKDANCYKYKQIIKIIDKDA